MIDCFSLEFSYRGTGFVSIRSRSRLPAALVQKDWQYSVHKGFMKNQLLGALNCNIYGPVQIWSRGRGACQTAW